jgi:hypothetical protein
MHTIKEDALHAASSRSSSLQPTTSLQNLEPPSIFLPQFKKDRAKLPTDQKVF